MTTKISSNSSINRNKIINAAYPAIPITETLTNGFFTVDRDWKVTYWNKASEKILGVASKDILGKNLWEQFADVIPLEFYAVYQKAFIANIPVHFEEYWGEMGAWFDVITYYSDDILSVSFKSSNHPHAEYPNSIVQRLKVLTELYKYVTEITNDCLWEWDLVNQEIFWIDGGHKRVFGYAVENALMPQSFWEHCIHPDDKVRVLAKLNKTIKAKTATIWVEEYRFKKADGTYAHVHDRGHIIYDDEKRPCRIVGATQDITEKVLLKRKLLHERLAKQREITEAVFMSQEHERGMLGKELHDNLSQVLAVTNIYIGMAKKSKKNQETYLNKATELIKDVLDEINRISKTLAAPDKVISLSDSIQNSLVDIMKIHPIKIEFREKGINKIQMDEMLQLNIFRIIQEQLNNILIHADASIAFISLRVEDDEIKLLISDNGKGHDLSVERKGMGIINIMSRAELYHGTVKIISKAGEGYDMRIVLKNHALGYYH